MKFLLISGIILILLLIYFRLAAYYQIVDNPTKRSSHKKPTIRGGGIIFPIAAIFWFLLFDLKDIWVITGLVIISLVSFIDDLKNLSRVIRFLTHIIAVSLLFAGTKMFHYPVYIWAPAFIIILGWINIFNFMDGINGITAFYSLIFFITILYLVHFMGYTSYDFPLVMVISVLIFAFFNARKNARIFAGDVGSITIAYILAFFMIMLISKTGRIEYLLFLSVYGIDSVVTILFRIFQGENIFEAHRTHLYQFMSNELNLEHIKVAALYAITQMLINVFTLIMIEKEKMNMAVFFSTLSILLIFYLTIRLLIFRRIKGV